MAALDTLADAGKQFNWVQTGCGGESTITVGKGKEGRNYYVGRSMCIVTVYSVPYKM